MKLETYVDSTKDTAVNTAHATRDESTCSRDSCFFTSILEDAPGASSSPAARYMSPVLTDALAHLRNSKKHMANLLKSTSNELDIEKFRKYPSLLSNVQLTSQLLVKCLAKTTQGIDKISNLQ